MHRYRKNLNANFLAGTYLIGQEIIFLLDLGHGDGLISSACFHYGMTCYLSYTVFLGL